MKKIIGVLIFLLVSATLFANENCEYLQKVSVTVKSKNSEGSGCVIVHDMKENKDSKETVKVAFILTAGHVIDDLRKTREIVNPNGDKKTLVEFDDAAVVKEFRQNSIKVGEIKLDVKIIKYSDSNNGEDIGLLLVKFYNCDLTQNTTEFYIKENLDDEILPVGTPLYHCGSLLGQAGDSSITTGVISQNGRVYEGKTYTQTTVTAFPGSSGGGVWIKDNDGKFKYCSMLVRGSGETFNFATPLRRIHQFFIDNNLEWVLNQKLPKPTIKEVMNISPETIKVGGSSKQLQDEKSNRFEFLDGEHANFFVKNSEILIEK
ncbi:trypsin-like peptidase domain-containing protein [archaeon]|nr:trypsin-like peptidase domain-containing protein [archaeon]